MRGKRTANPHCHGKNESFEGNKPYLRNKNINLEELLQDPPTAVVYPDELVYKLQVKSYTQQFKHEGVTE